MIIISNLQDVVIMDYALENWIQVVFKLQTVLKDFFFVFVVIGEIVVSVVIHLFVTLHVPLKQTLTTLSITTWVLII